VRGDFAGRGDAAATTAADDIGTPLCNSKVTQISNTANAVYSQQKVVVVSMVVSQSEAAARVPGLIWVISPNRCCRTPTQTTTAAVVRSTPLQVAFSHHLTLRLLLSTQETNDASLLDRHLWPFRLAAPATSFVSASLTTH
jgi:hypothetical protein